MPKKSWKADIVTAVDGWEKWAVVRNFDSVSEPARIVVTGENPQAGRLARKLAKMLNMVKKPNGEYTHGC